MSDMEEEKNYSSIDEDEVEFIDYNIDDEPDSYVDDVAKLSSEAKKKFEKETFSLKKEILSWVLMMVIAVGIAVFTSSFIIYNAVVPTGSMENTIPIGSRMLGLRLSYTFSDPERGDIIIFKNPYNEEEDYVKRIIGLPEETVIMENSQIMIYDSKGTLKVGPLDEPYLKDEVWTREGERYEFKVPEGKYLVLGDNRNGSSDARAWYNKALTDGSSLDKIYIDESKILAKAYFTYWDSFNWFEDIEYN